MDSLNMQLPRGWYQVAGLTPPTFRRHCLSSKSGTLEVSFLDAESSAMSGEEALDFLAQSLERQDIRVGAPLKTGHESCAAGVMAYGVYKHIGGQKEYWIIPHEEATVFACWQMGAMATAGMERHDIHEMLKKLHFEHTEEVAEAAEAADPEVYEEEIPANEPHMEGDVFVIADDPDAEEETGQQFQHEEAEHGG